MKKMKKILALAVWIAALGLLCASCDNGLDIQQAYTFSLETMPVQKRISVGETAEIRYPLDREVFRLYYTSRSDDQQAIDVYVEDNTGQVVKTSFTFQSENGTEETER